MVNVDQETQFAKSITFYDTTVLFYNTLEVMGHCTKLGGEVFPSSP